MLPQTVDFDDDGLLEVIVNQRERGSISDTLRFFAWGGIAFLPADPLLVSVIPRDLADPDGDGLENLLAQIAAATLLLEQLSNRAIPSRLAVIDTTGLDRGSVTTDDLIGAQLTDIDRDGRGEIAGHNGTESGHVRCLGRGCAEIAIIHPSELFTADFDDDGIAADWR